MTICCLDIECEVDSTHFVYGLAIASYYIAAEIIVNLCRLLECISEDSHLSSKVWGSQHTSVFSVPCSISVYYVICVYLMNMLFVYSCCNVIVSLCSVPLL